VAPLQHERYHSLMAIAADTGLRAKRAGHSVMAAWVSLVLIASCRHAPDPIRVDRGRLVVENQTDQEWRDVTVTVNAYYRGGAPTLLPSGRLETPLTNFVTGLGQRFDVNRERVRRVEVRATTAAGQPVALNWAGTMEKRR
jgi:hypothetical protein